MSVNIMDLVKGAVSDQVMGQIGGLLGTDAKKTPSLFETAAGSILGGMMKKGSTAQGAQDIFGAVEKQDDSILDKLGDLMGGGDATDAYEKQGSGILDMVMGGSQQSQGMIGMVAKALGLDKGIVGKLLVMAAPILMGVIGRHVKSKALDAVGLGKLLGEQKSHLSGSMPSSLVSNLGFGEMLGSAKEAVGNVAGAAGDVAGSVTGAAGNVAGAAGDMASGAVKTGGGILKYILGVGVLAIGAMFLVPWIIDMQSRSVPDIDPSEINAKSMVTDFAKIPGIDTLGETGVKLSGGFSDIALGLKDVTDEAGATSLAEKITGFTGEIDGIGLDQLEGNALNVRKSMVTKFIEAVQNMLSGKSDGVQGILKPVIDTLMEKLSPFSG